MKRYIEISECKTGCVLAEDIYNTMGGLVVLQNTVINDYIKCKLNLMGINRILVFDPDMRQENAEGDSLDYQEFKKNYQENIFLLKETLNDLAKGNKLDLNKIKNISDSLYCSLKNKHHIISNLNKVRNTDEYTYTHCLNVSFYAMLLAKWMKLPEKTVKEVVSAGLLHDVGKTRVPLQILNKNTRLSFEEFEEVKKHSQYGYNIVEPIDELSDDVKRAVLMHHEREDSSGYPVGVRGDQLNIHTKIIAIADVYDAITSDRVYKKKETPFEAFLMFQTVGFKSFDTRILNTFLTNISNCYIGAKVLLNTGETGEIVYVAPHEICYPIVKVGNRVIDISNGEGMTIEEIV